jgi:hypothetical protein
MLTEPASLGMASSVSMRSRKSLPTAERIKDRDSNQTKERLVILRLPRLGCIELFFKQKIVRDYKKIKTGIVVRKQLLPKTNDQLYITPSKIRRFLTSASPSRLLLVRPHVNNIHLKPLQLRSGELAAFRKVEGPNTARRAEISSQIISSLPHCGPHRSVRPSAIASIHSFGGNTGFDDPTETIPVN